MQTGVEGSDNRSRISRRAGVVVAIQIASVAAFYAFSAAEAAGLPRYAVDRHCDQVASFGGSTSETLRDSCFEMEQIAYDAMKSYWDSLPQAMRAHCDNVATFGGSGSYSLLESCIQMERSAQQKNTNREFKY